MFDIGAFELLLIVVVAVIVIGPKDMPMALRTAGRWIGKIRRVSSHFRTGLDAMVREAELEEMEKKWKAQNDAIMAKTGGGAEMTGPPPAVAGAADAANPASAESAAERGENDLAPAAPSKQANRPESLSNSQAKAKAARTGSEPELPLGGHAQKKSAD